MIIVSCPFGDLYVCVFFISIFIYVGDISPQKLETALKTLCANTNKDCANMLMTTNRLTVDPMIIDRLIRCILQVRGV